MEGPSRFSSVILKQITSDEFTDADPESSVSTRLLNELATLEFLESTRPGGPWPDVIAQDAEIGLIVIEDLGRHPSVLHALLGEDPELARQGLTGLGLALADLHVAGLGRAAEFESYQHRRGARSPRSDSTRRIVDLSEHVRASIETLGIPSLPGFWSELDDVDEAMALETPRATVIHADAGPQNFVLGEERVAILDFEFAVVGHPALDLVSARLGFPHTVESHRLKEPDIELVEGAYRKVAREWIPWVEDQAEYERVITDACAVWAVGRWGSLWPTIFAPGASQESEADLARSRALVLYEAFISTASRFDRRQAIAGTLQLYVEAVRELWPELVSVGGYPALS